VQKNRKRRQKPRAGVDEFEGKRLRRMQLRPGLAYPRPHCLQAIVRELHPLPLPLEPSLHSAQKPADTSLGVLLLLDLDIAHPHPLVHLLHVSLSPPSLSLCRYLENRSGVPEAAQCRRPHACDAQGPSASLLQQRKLPPTSLQLLLRLDYFDLAILTQLSKTPFDTALCSLLLASELLSPSLPLACPFFLILQPRAGSYFLWHRITYRTFSALTSPS